MCVWTGDWEKGHSVNKKLPPPPSSSIFAQKCKKKKKKNTHKKQKTKPLSAAIKKNIYLNKVVTAITYLLSN